MIEKWEEYDKKHDYFWEKTAADPSPLLQSILRSLPVQKRLGVQWNMGLVWNHHWFLLNHPVELKEIVVKKWNNSEQEREERHTQSPHLHGPTGIARF